MNRRKFLGQSSVPTLLAQVYFVKVDDATATLDIPFAFDLAPTMVGNGPERQPLADKMSAAWVAFARSGNPNHKGIPKWEPFNADSRATMIFNNQCSAVDDPYHEERHARASVRPPESA